MQLTVGQACLWSTGQALFFPPEEPLTGGENSADPASCHRGRFFRRRTRAAGPTLPADGRERIGQPVWVTWRAASERPYAWNPLTPGEKSWWCTHRGFEGKSQPLPPEPRVIRRGYIWTLHTFSFILVPSSLLFVTLRTYPSLFSISRRVKSPKTQQMWFFQFVSS